MNGMSLVFLSTLCFTTGNFMLSIMGPKVPPLQSAFYRFSVQASISFFSIAVTNREHVYCVTTWIGLNHNFKKIILRSIFGILAVVSWFTAVQAMPLADATAINYLNIPMTSILAALILKEPYRFPFTPQFLLFQLKRMSVMSHIFSNVLLTLAGFVQPTAPSTQSPQPYAWPGFSWLSSRRICFREANRLVLLAPLPPWRCWLRSGPCAHHAPP